MQFTTSEMVNEAINALPLGASNGTIIEWVYNKYGVSPTRKFVSDIKEENKKQVQESLNSQGINKSIELPEPKKVRKCDAVREALKDLTEEASHKDIIKYVKEEYGIEVDTDYISYRKYEDKRINMETNKSTRECVNLTSKQLCVLFDTIRDNKDHFLTTRPTRNEAANFLSKKLGFKVTAAHVARAQEATGTFWKMMPVKESKYNRTDLELIATCLLDMDDIINKQTGLYALDELQKEKLRNLVSNNSKSEDE